MRGRLAVVSEPQHIFPGRDVFRHLEDVAHGDPVVVTYARGAVRLECGLAALAVVVAATAVTAGRAGARKTRAVDQGCFAGQASVGRRVGVA